MFLEATTLVALSSAAYLISTITIWMSSRAGQETSKSAPGGVSAFMLLAHSAVTLVAIGGHGYLLYLGIETGHGQDLGADKIFSLITWVGAILAFSLNYIPSLKRQKAIGVFIYPLAIFALLLGLGLHESHVIQTKEHKGVLVHIFLSLAAMSFLGLGALQSCLYALQDWCLKNTTTAKGRLLRSMMDIITQLPPLQNMESFLFKLISIGTLFLTISIVTGICYVENFFSVHASLLPKSLITLIAWVYYSGLIAGHHFWGWRGKKAVNWTWIGTLFLLCGYFGTKLLLKITYT